MLYYGTIESTEMNQGPTTKSRRLVRATCINEAQEKMLDVAKRISGETTLDEQTALYRHTSSNDERMIETFIGDRHHLIEVWKFRRGKARARNA